MSSGYTKDDGLDPHQLGNELLRAGRLAEAAESFGKAIDIRKRLVEKSGSAELMNLLAGSYKMRATARMLPLRNIGVFNDAVLKPVRTDIGIAVRTRKMLLGENADDVDLAHDYAMTLWTRAWIEGSAWNHRRALEDLAAAEAILRRLVDEEARMGWLPDLAMCLADTVRFGVGLGRGQVSQKLLQQADECLELYSQLLNAGFSDVRTKYLEFLAHGAAPAAYILNKPARSVEFLHRGLQEVEAILKEKPVDRAGLGGSALYFAIPAEIVKDLARHHGLDIERFETLQRTVKSVLAVPQAPGSLA